jgi:O-antigen/teichoic acid export membrane protein
MIKLITRTFLSRIIIAVFNFITIVLISKELGPEGKGIASQIIAVIAMIQIICDLMGGAALVYLGARKSILSLIIPSYIFSILILFLAVVFFVVSNNTYFSFSFYQLIFLSFFSTTLNQHYHLLNSREKFQMVNVLSIAQAFIILFILYFLPLKKDGISVYIVSLYAGWCIPWLVSLIILLKYSKSENNFERSAWKAIFKFGKLNQFGHLIQFSTQRLAYVFLPLFSLGIYSNAVTISESIWMFASSIATIQYGKIANMKSSKEAIPFTISLLKITVIITFFFALFVGLLPEYFFEWLFGPDFRGIKSALIPLLPGIIAIGGYLIIGHFFSGIGAFSKNNYAMLSGLIFTIISWVSLKYIFQLEVNFAVAAWITCFSNICTFIFIILMFKNQFNLQWLQFVPNSSDFKLMAASLKNIHGKNK